MEKFTVAGTTMYKGQTKVRFANDLATRVKTLVKNEHTEIELFELPSEMTKPEALAWLATQKLSAAAQEAVANKASEYEPKQAKAPKAAKPAKAKAAPKAKAAKTAAPKQSKKTATKATPAKKAVTSIAAKARAAKAASTETIVTPVTSGPAADMPAVA